MLKDDTRKLGKTSVGKSGIHTRDKRENTIEEFDEIKMFQVTSTFSERKIKKNGH